MNSFFNNDYLKSMMDNFSQPFANGFPFGGNNNNDFQKMMTDTMNQYMPPYLKTSQPSTQTTPKHEKKIDYTVYETHEFVIARINLLANQSTKIRLLLDSHQLVIKNADPDGSDLKITLPSAVKPKYAKADYKEGILEVRMMKKGPESMSEISIDKS